jgi:hypothetical protein
MQVLDSFISLVRLDGDILILAVLVLARPPSDEPVSNLSVGASANASKTRSSKWKAVANSTSQKKTKKATGRSSSGIRIDEPTPKSFASIFPFLGPRSKIPIHRSKRYTHHEYASSLTTS